MNRLSEFFLRKKVKLAVLAILSVLYLAGIAALFFNTGLGVLLWGAALLPSLIWYLFNQHQQQLMLERKIEAEKSEEGSEPQQPSQE